MRAAAPVECSSCHVPRPHGLNPPQLHTEKVLRTGALRALGVGGGKPSAGSSRDRRNVMEPQRLRLVSGSRSGGLASFKSDIADIAPSSNISYQCTHGHRFFVRYSYEAETLPNQVGCKHCHKLSYAITADPRLTDVVDDVANSPAVRRRVTPLRSLHMRRSEKDLQALLDRALELLHGSTNASRAT